MYPDENIGLFVDGPNFYQSVRGLGLEPDYGRIKSFFPGRLRAAVYVTALKESGNDPVRTFTDYLSYNGWRLVTKPVKSLPDGSLKANMDIEFALEALKAADFCDHIVLFTGDSDFAPVIAALQARGVRVTVVSTMDNVADELRRQSDAFIDLKSIASEIQRHAAA